MIDNPIPWPNGARCAVSITFDMDSDSILDLAHPDRAHKLVSTRSWLRYDRVAVPRILEIYRRLDIRQTFFVPAWCIERYPATVEAIVKAGHEIAHHGYMHEHPNEQTPEDELALLQRGSSIIEAFTGQKPRGWRAPLYNFSDVSASLLASEGFLYDSSLMGDDIPYLLRTLQGDVVELPTHWAMDDWPQYTHSIDLDYLMPINAPDRAMEVFRAEFDAAWEFGGLLVAVWHPFVSGRLARSLRVASFLEYMIEKGGVWIATMEDIAAHVLEVRGSGAYSPRVESMD